MTDEQNVPAPPTGIPTPPGEVSEESRFETQQRIEREHEEGREAERQADRERQAGKPSENDDKTDVQPRPEPKVEGDHQGAPLDNPDDQQFVKREGAEEGEQGSDGA
jgi:hypothetical protein